MNERITELEEQVRYHSECYHNGMPEITDAEFDELVDELKGLDPDSPALMEVGAIPAWGRKVKHERVMGSLDKVNEPGALLAWLEKYGTEDSVLIAGPKMDGLSLSLRYANGVLVGAATRGDGKVGQDVVENARHIDGIPKLTVDDTFTGEVRGEVYMRKDVWKSFGGQFANPRNGAAGGLLQKDARETANRNLSFMAFKVYEKGRTFATEAEMATRGSQLGFEYVVNEKVESIHLEAYLMDWEENRRPELPYIIDGLVFSLQSIEEQEDAGWQGDHHPLGKVAWKFKPEQREAVVRGVDWQVGRTGKLTPVLRIEPTHVDGSTISNISLHSSARFIELGLCKGEKVLIEKAGDIIPQVVRVTWRNPGADKLELPSFCTSCGNAVEQDGAHLWCKNLSCSSQLERRVLYWLREVDVKGAGPGIVSDLCQSGAVESVSDLYYLQPADIEDAIGSKAVADKVLKEIALKSELTLPVFLAALGIPGLGHTVSKTVAKKYGCLEGALSSTVSELSTLDGIGETIAQQVVTGLEQMADEIEALVRVLEIEDMPQGGVLDGLSFCLTGAMSRGRKEIAADIESAGGTVKSSVGKGLTYLVQADPTSQSSKTKKAAKYGTEVISEEALMEMMA